MVGRKHRHILCDAHHQSSSTIINRPMKHLEFSPGNNGLSFSPNSTTAAKGDTVVFHFFPGKHSVAQGAFDSPCAPLSNGFYSGYLDSSSGESETTFVVTVNDTNPIWYYCSQVSHCQNGMVGVINPPSSGNTLEAYSAASAKTQKSTAPNNVAGGVFAKAGDSSSSASGSASATASASGSASGSASATSATATASGTPTGSASASAASATKTGVASSLNKGQFLNIFAAFDFVAYFLFL
ncbi:Cupredoxin [Glonium stellatum]|uniref:Cupredoxin n=1 Tax=Glonium stellatum TaxID=574774 RepID=A0A8E2F6G5_9PEZI|nr:Cupredoxin [Glonium stellatum]